MPATAWQKKRWRWRNHCRSNYAYSYETIDAYQGTRRSIGFCSKQGTLRIFAAQMAVMLLFFFFFFFFFLFFFLFFREIGIRRVAIGYSRRRTHPLTGTPKWRRWKGHAWAEGGIAAVGGMFEAGRVSIHARSTQDATTTARLPTRRSLSASLAAPSGSCRRERCAPSRCKSRATRGTSARHLQQVLYAGRARVAMVAMAAALLAACVDVLDRRAARLARQPSERREVARLLRPAQGDNGGAVLSLAQAIGADIRSRGCTRSAQRRCDNM